MDNWAWLQKWVNPINKNDHIKSRNKDIQKKVQKGFGLFYLLLRRIHSSQHIKYWAKTCAIHISWTAVL